MCKAVALHGHIKIHIFFVFSFLFMRFAAVVRASPAAESAGYCSSRRANGHQPDQMAVQGVCGTEAGSRSSQWHGGSCFWQGRASGPR